eukprot:2617593-Amphidinium_carterae.1
MCTSSCCSQTCNAVLQTSCQTITVLAIGGWMATYCARGSASSHGLGLSTDEATFRTYNLEMLSLSATSGDASYLVGTRFEVACEKAATTFY